MRTSRPSSRLCCFRSPMRSSLAARPLWPLWRPLSAGTDPCPLYYRLAASWAGRFTGRVRLLYSAALAAGRLLSAFGFLATLAAAYRLARLGGMPPQGRVVGRSARRGHADFWRLPFRGPARHAGHRVPDDRHPAGALGTREAPRSARPSLPPPACFAVAACIKQHYLVGAARQPVLDGGCPGARAARPRGDRAVRVDRVWRSSCFITARRNGSPAGRMSQSVVVAAGNVGARSPGGLVRRRNLLLAVIWKCVGLILLLAAAGLAMVSARPGPARRAL